MSNNKTQKPTDILKKDHKIIKDIIKVLETCANSIYDGGKCDLGILNGSMELIRNFTHKYHRRTEEGVLFKIAEKKESPWSGGNISSMLREHEEGAEQVRRVADLLRDSVEKGISTKKTRKAVAKNLFAYSSLLGSHLIQEEKTLYPMIESLLTKQEKNNILQSFERLENEMKEIGDKERYANSIKEYKKRLAI